MPKVLEDLVSKLKAQGHDEDSAWAIATSQLQKSGKLKKGSQNLTEKGRNAGSRKKAGRTKA